MIAKGGPNDGEAYYAPMLARRVHEEPERMLELPPVASALAGRSIGGKFNAAP